MTSEAATEPNVHDFPARVLVSSPPNCPGNTVSRQHAIGLYSTVATAWSFSVPNGEMVESGHKLLAWSGRDNCMYSSLEHLVIE
jgi:hypothetical protein